MFICFYIYDCILVFLGILYHHNNTISKQNKNHSASKMKKKKLRTAILIPKFTGSYKKKSVHLLLTT